MAIVFEKFHFLVTVFISYVKKEGKTGQTCLRAVGQKRFKTPRVDREAFLLKTKNKMRFEIKTRSVDRTQKPTSLHEYFS